MSKITPQTGKYHDFHKSYRESYDFGWGYDSQLILWSKNHKSTEDHYSRIPTLKIDFEIGPFALPSRKIYLKVMKL